MVGRWIWIGPHTPQLNEKIATDGFEWIGALFMMMLFKGFFSSLAGPVPGYDMQRLLSTKTPLEAAKDEWLYNNRIVFSSISDDRFFCYFGYCISYP